MYEIPLKISEVSSCASSDKSENENNDSVEHADLIFHEAPKYVDIEREREMLEYEKKMYDLIAPILTDAQQIRDGCNAKLRELFEKKSQAAFKKYSESI